MIFSTLYHELVCHVEHFSVELDTLHQHMTKALQVRCWILCLKKNQEADSFKISTNMPYIHIIRIIIV